MITDSFRSVFLTVAEDTALSSVATCAVSVLSKHTIAGCAASKSERLREDLLGIEKSETQVVELQQKVGALSNQAQQHKRRNGQLEAEV